MKKALVLITTVLSTTVFASTFKNVTTLTNPSLDSAAKSISKVEGVYASSFKKVVVLKANASTPEGQRQKTIAQAAHTLCGFFDDGVDVGLEKADDMGSKRAANTFKDNAIEDKDDIVLKSIAAVNGKYGVEVYSGSASGNNTGGTVLGFYDTVNGELAVFAATNCGSDD